MFAIGVTGLHGKTSSRAVNSAGFLPFYSADRYVKGTEAVTAELVE